MGFPDAGRRHLFLFLFASGTEKGTSVSSQRPDYSHSKKRARAITFCPGSIDFLSGIDYNQL